MAAEKVLDERVEGASGGIPGHPRVDPLTVKSFLKVRSPGLNPVSSKAAPLEALKLMAEQDLEAVLVMEDGRVAGTFSTRDYARSQVRAQGAQTVLEVMTPCRICASPGDSVRECLALMAENHLRHLPVMEDGKPVALLAREEMLEAMVAYLEQVFKQTALDQRILGLRGTYSC